MSSQTKNNGNIKQWEYRFVAEVFRFCSLLLLIPQSTEKSFISDYLIVTLFQAIKRFFKPVKMQDYFKR